MSVNKKIVVSSQPPGGLESLVDPRFGRCAFFTVVSVIGNEMKQEQIVPNGGMQAMGGAGIQAAQTVANLGGTVVITGNLGPNASASLNQLGISVAISGVVTVKDAVKAYLEGKLQTVSSSTVGAHAGMGMGMGRGMGGGRGGGMGGGRGQRRPYWGKTIWNLGKS